MSSLMQSASAQQSNTGNGFRISPLVKQIPARDSNIDSIDPGERTTFEINITNVTSDPLIAKAEFNDFLPRNESGSPSIIIDTTQENEFGLRTYFSPIEDFRLEPSEDKTVEVTMDVPANATPGGHFGIVRFTAIPVEGDETVTVSASVGTIVLMNISGEAEENLDLVEFTAGNVVGEDSYEAKSFFETGPISIFTRLQNSGNTFVAPFGSLKLKNTFGSEVQSYQLNDVFGNVLPDSIRRFETSLGDRFYLGRYTVEGTISYGGGGDIINVSDTFWVLPYKVIVPAVLGLAVIIFGGRILVTRYNDKIVAKSRRR